MIFRGAGVFVVLYWGWWGVGSFLILFRRGGSMIGRSILGFIYFSFLGGLLGVWFFL